MMKKAILCLAGAMLVAWGAGADEGAVAAGEEQETIQATEQQETTNMSEETKVVIKTSKGDITVKLDADKAPLTVQNFLDYVDSGFYAGTIFHRVINGFMIQGGGLDRQMRQKATRKPIPNEAANGLKNKRGTIAMARTMVVDSATSQFFINVVDNDFLDYRSPDMRGFGYCVFGEVVDGMDVVDAIKETPTARGDVPVETIEILSVERVK